MLYKVECNEVTLRWLPILLLLFCLRATFAQNPPPPQSVTPPDSTLQLSPQAAYDQASRPLDIVRKPAENWSDVEQAALAVAVGQAKEACSARSPFQYTGEDLLAYARLCALHSPGSPSSKRRQDT